MLVTWSDYNACKYNPSHMHSYRISQRDECEKAIYENRFGDKMCGCGVWEVVAHLINCYNLGQDTSTPTTVQWTRGWALQRKQNNNIRNKAQIRLLSYEEVGDGCKGR